MFALNRFIDKSKQTSLVNLCKQRVQEFERVAPDYPAYDFPDDLKLQGAFDPNSYFSFLEHMQLRKGKVLDYVYLNSSNIFGWPWLYTRALSDAPFLTDKELVDWEQPDLRSYTYYLDDIVVDGTSDGFLEFSLFIELADRFYLWNGYTGPDATPFEFSVICDYDDLALLMDDYQEWYVDTNDLDWIEWQKEQIQRLRDEARTVDLGPEIVMNDDVVIVSISFFGQQVGLNRIIYVISRESPHIIISEEWQLLVEYDSGAVY